jgi:hypothetical protein
MLPLTALDASAALAKQHSDELRGQAARERLVRGLREGHGARAGRSRPGRAVESPAPART